MRVRLLYIALKDTSIADAISREDCNTATAEVQRLGWSPIRKYLYYKMREWENRIWRLTESFPLADEVAIE